MLPFSLHAEETVLIVRAKAKDAKFIGSSIGGARVLVRDVTSGKLLAEGMTSGSTGNTTRIMNEAHERYTTLSDEKTAHFEAVLDISEPVLVEVEVIAPYQKRQAAVRATTQLWVIPGKHIDGDGLVVEIPGMVVDVLSPQTHEVMNAAEEGETSLTITANVVMMCGCPIGPETTWKSENYEVVAMIQAGGETIKTVPMQITDKTSTFSATTTVPGKGYYGVIVYAYDAKTGNTGVDKSSAVIR
jgi:hypothetical protein